MVPMCPHVTVQIATLRKTCVTDLALVRFLPSMGAVVLSEGGAVSKTFAACTAFVRAIPRVCPHMSGDGTALGEPSVTYRTLEGLLSAVSAQMSSEVGCLSKRFLADGTLVWFLPGVGA